MLFPLTSIGQDYKTTGYQILPEINGKVVYTEVIIVDSASKNDLFVRAKIWLADKYKSANDVTQFSDKEAGELVAKGNLTIYWYTKGLISVATPVTVWHTFKISVKDGKYKYEVSEFKGTYHMTGYGYSTGQDVDFPITNAYMKMNDKNQKLHVQTLHGFDDKIKGLIESLKIAMVKPTSNW